MTQEDLYDRLVSLLGKPPDESTRQCLMDILGGANQSVHQTKNREHVTVTDLGVMVMIDKRQQQVKSLHFHLATAMVDAGNAKQFPGTLMRGISAGDTPDDVHRKVGQQPTASSLLPGRTPLDPKFISESYDFDPLEVSISFSGVTGRISLVSVRYVIDTVPPEPPPPEPTSYLETSCNPGALRVLSLAQEEVGRFRTFGVGSEQILLGILRYGEGPANEALLASGVTLDAARAEVEKIVGIGVEAVETPPPFTPMAKKMLAEALKQASKGGSDKICTEHLLLGLIETGEGVGIRVLGNLGVDLVDLQRQVLLLCTNDGEERRTPDTQGETS